MLGIPQYLWRLLPGNPILLRVVAVASRRRRDLAIRCTYLGVLVFFVVFRLLTSGSSVAGASLDTLSRTSSRIFEQMSYLQMALVALLAPIFTAGAITQERDSQTYDILLSTPLTNGQIVLGTLMSRLFFVVALLVSGIPVFAITQLFGGVAIHSIVMSFLLATVTAVACGALALAIATFKTGTRRTLFSFYLVVAVYLVGGLLLDRVDTFRVALADPSTGLPSSELSRTSWLTALNPFLALRTLFREPAYSPPPVAMLPESLRRWPFAWMLGSPASFYLVSMSLLSVALILPSVLFLRRLAQSTFSLRDWFVARLRRGETVARKPRVVWNNPVAWREARTRASTAKSSLLRVGFIVAGLLGAAWMLALHATETGTPVKTIRAGSYNPQARTLHIVGDDTYGLRPDVKVTLDGEPAEESVLAHRFEVVDTLAEVRSGVRELSSISLRTIERFLGHDDLRRFLLGAVVLELAVILLIVTNAAASAVTREREDGTLELLLSTPITSRYYIWGKLRGLVSFALPMLAVPLLSIVMVIGFDALRRLSGNATGHDWLVMPESLLVLPGMLVVVVAFAAMIGMQMSLRLRTTVRAVMASMAIVMGAMVALGWCGGLFLGSGDSQFSLVFPSFSPFTVLMLQVWPTEFAPQLYGSTDDRVTARAVVSVFSLVATGVYVAVVLAMYRSMVRNFDMTIRRQSS